MDIRASLLADRSKANVLAIANYIGDDQALFDHLVDLFLNDKWRVGQRAVWVMSHAAQKRPHLVLAHLKAMLDKLEVPNIHDAVKRNVTKILSEITIPEEHQGRALDICFGFLISMEEAIAIKVFSMQVVYNISQNEPDLLRELALVIEDQMPYGSAGFKARGKKILKAIRKKVPNYDA